MIAQIKQDHLRILRLLAVAGLAAALVLEVRAQTQWAALGSQFVQHWSGLSAGWLLATLALMPLNWLAENRKWLPMLRRYQPWSEWAALKVVLAGAAMSLLTPNRIGDVGGRLLLVGAEHRWQALTIHAVCNAAQILALLTPGFFGAWRLGRQFAIAPPEMITLFLVCGFMALCCAWALYFNISALARLAARWPLLSRAQHFVKDRLVLEAFSGADLAHALRWSFIRCGIYATQYYLLIRFFGIDVGVFDGFACIFVLFALQTGIPLPLVGGWLLRGNLAVIGWSYWHADPIASLAATFTLWIINLIVPALIGTFSLFFVQTAKTTGYDKD